METGRQSQLVTRRRLLLPPYSHTGQESCRLDWTDSCDTGEQPGPSCRQRDSVWLKATMMLEAQNMQQENQQGSSGRGDRF